MNIRGEASQITKSLFLFPLSSSSIGLNLSPITSTCSICWSSRNKVIRYVHNYFKVWSYFSPTAISSHGIYSPELCINGCMVALCLLLLSCMSSTSCAAALCCNAHSRRLGTKKGPSGQGKKGKQGLLPTYVVMCHSLSQYYIFL